MWRVQCSTIVHQDGAGFKFFLWVGMAGRGRLKGGWILLLLPSILPVPTSPPHTPTAKTVCLKLH